MAASGMKAKNTEEIQDRGLIDLIFSWSIPDVMNRNLFLGKVTPIPKEFSSTSEYFKSFINPLIEETHADLQSNMKTVARAPFCEVKELKRSKDFKLPKNFCYLMSFSKVDEKQRQKGTYEPQSGDLIALTNARPKCIDDLNTHKRPYTLAFIQGRKDEDSDEFSVLSSKLVDSEEEYGRKSEALFAVYLINLTTNIRIWKALHPDPEVANMNIIRNILHSDLKAGIGKNCLQCSADGSKEANAAYARERIQSFGLDISQQSAVIDCVALKDCDHQNTVKLIWGPPGTGKTKTVASLLMVLLQMKCRAVACAPTNIAVTNVAQRLMSLLRPTLEYDTYGLGDIVLFGNAMRMKIDDSEDLYDIFLDNRVSALSDCIAPISGWKGSVGSMTQLLEDPEQQYQSYLSKEKERRESRDKDDDREVEDNSRDTFEDFFLKTFNEIGKRLLRCLVCMYTHLPTSLVSVHLAKKMTKACELLRKLGTLYSEAAKGEGLTSIVAKAGTPHLNEIRRIREKCLKTLKFLDQSICLSNWLDLDTLVKFCLENAQLIFCTCSSSAKLHAETKKALDLLVIDEAAQLKECESAIPMQLSGLRHAILIGDEMQLPAMVQSQICERADFGRSLFERLVMLGHEKHLLSVQYRMHPSISQFPNRQFYQNKIQDGPNVKCEAHKKKFLDGLMYGPCSFINISGASDHVDGSHSKKNLVEAFVVAGIVAKLHRESTVSKQKIRVGCVSPYKDQVYAIQERLGETYNTDAESDFSVDVRSVDGFQGGEEDVIIISTVRCNGSGSVGFLANLQRTNVALTRARLCLWILGNSTTLESSGTIWGKLVSDLKARRCFFDANEDKDLVQAMSCAFLELKQFDKMLNVDSLVVKSARWKICFTDEFSRALARIKDSDIQKEVTSIITKLSSGWRPPHDQKLERSYVYGTSSLLLEMCDVKALKLIWNTDIQREDSYDIQVVKVQDILPVSGIKKLVTRLNVAFENYTMKTIARCKYRKLEGNLVVPKKWPVESKPEESSATTSDDLEERISSKFAALRLKEKSPSFK